VCLVGHEVRQRNSRTPEIQTLNITNDEQQKENNRIHQFFSSLLETGLPSNGWFESTKPNA